jgi:hypothetical protein
MNRASNGAPAAPSPGRCAGIPPRGHSGNSHVLGNGHLIAREIAVLASVHLKTELRRALAAVLATPILELKPLAFPQTAICTGAPERPFFEMAPLLVD